MYGVYIVSGQEENFDKFNTNAQEVMKLATNSKKSKNLLTLITWMVQGLNNQELSDTDWYFFIDESNKIIFAS